MKALLAGASGLVGGRLVDALVRSGAEIVSIGRRSLGDARLDERIVDFASLAQLPQADVAFCSLGTTRARAGSSAAFRAVDHDAVLAYAEAARQAGVERFVLVTSVGADARALALYPRVKGEVEGAVEALGFSRLDILQPGLLLGSRSEHRPVEALLQRSAPLLSPLFQGRWSRYGAIDADVVARAMVQLSDAAQPGIFRHENAALRNLAAVQAER